MSDNNAAPPAVREAGDRRIKLVCGHRVIVDSPRDGDTAWCPLCQRELFTGWPQHLEDHAKLAEKLKRACGSYLDQCIETGVKPRLAAIVGACESAIETAAFNQGYKSGGAIDAD